MNIKIDITADDAADLRSLLTRLRRVDGLTANLVPATPGPGEQGAGWELLTMTFGAGGIGFVALRTVQTWLESRRSRIRVRVHGTGADREVEVELDATSVAAKVRALMPVLEKMLDGPA